MCSECCITSLQNSCLLEFGGLEKKWTVVLSLGKWCKFASMPRVIKRVCQCTCHRLGGKLFNPPAFFSLLSVWYENRYLSSCLSFVWKRCGAGAPRLATARFFASNQMKSLLLTLSCSSHSRWSIFAISRSLPAWRQAAMLTTSGRFPIISPRLKRKVSVVYGSAWRNLHNHASGLRLNHVGLMCLWASIAVIMQRFHLSCKANRGKVPSIDKCLHTSPSLRTNSLPSYSKAISWCLLISHS